MEEIYYSLFTGVNATIGIARDMVLNPNFEYVTINFSKKKFFLKTNMNIDARTDFKLTITVPCKIVCYGNSTINDNKSGIANGPTSRGV